MDGSTIGRHARFECVDFGEVATLYVHGDVDLDERSRFHDAVHDALRKPRVTLGIALNDVTFMDSSGVHELLEARHAAASRNVALVLVAPSVPVLRVLEVCGLTDLFDVRDANEGLGPRRPPSSR
jgi:anti-anti-sigma factor